MDPRKLVLRETAVISIGQAVGVAAMLGLFALLGRLDRTVLLGGVIGGLVAVGNFFIMAIGVNIAADKATAQDVKGGKDTLRLSQLLRTVGMVLILFAFAKSGLCNVIALVVPLLFVRITLTVTEFFKRKPGEESQWT